MYFLRLSVHVYFEKTHEGNMKKTILLALILTFSLNTFANFRFIDDLDKYNNIHKVLCYDESSINPEGFYLAFNEIDGKYGWHQNYMGDGTTEIADTSTDSNTIVLNNVKSSLGFKYGKIMTYDVERNILKVEIYDNSFYLSEVKEYSDCVPTDDIALHNPTTW